MRTIRLFIERPSLVVSATATATFLDQTPACATPKGLREATETIARGMRVPVKQLRDIYEQTGQRPFQLDSGRIPHVISAPA